jgi:pimeloyl-ACP methyl ester carboxylesterase
MASDRSDSALRYISIRPDLDLRVIEWGPASGEPFLLVHGLASNARMWDGVGAALADQGYRAVAVDQRGHGRSSKPDDGYDFATLSDDLARVCEALDLDAAVVVGQSWGGNVVCEFAIRHPEICRGVVAVDGGIIELAATFPDWETCAARLAPPRLTGTSLARLEGIMRAAHPDWPETGIQGALACFEAFEDGTLRPWLTFERHMTILRELWEHRPPTRYHLLHRRAATPHGRWTNAEPSMQSST